MCYTYSEKHHRAFNSILSTFFFTVPVNLQIPRSSKCTWMVDALKMATSFTISPVPVIELTILRPIRVFFYFYIKYQKTFWLCALTYFWSFSLYPYFCGRMEEVMGQSSDAVLSRDRPNRSPEEVTNQIPHCVGGIT